ncbi:MAG: enoyl-CoA hydratase-related protein [Steroidobacteraceae bacterium]
MSVLLEDTLAPGLIRLTLNRPAQRNALDTELIATLHATLQRLDTDPDCRVVLLAAQGAVFCAGADLHDMRALAAADAAANLADATALATLLATWRQLSRPTLCIVQGDALGGGLGLIAASDVALCTPRARFRLPEVRLGLMPAVISPYVTAAMGLRAAHRYMLSGEWFSAAQAQRLQLINEVLAADELQPAALAIATQMALGETGALAACKQLLRELPLHQGAERSSWTAAALAQRRATPAAQSRLTLALGGKR